MQKRQASIDQITDLILEVFRLNGGLVAAGDDLVRSLGLTSARWQVLGAISLAPAPMSVAQIARTMGLARQSVQRLVNELVEDGILRLADNPDHARARLVQLTQRGDTLYAAADKRQAPWAASLAEGVDADAIRRSIDLLRTLRQRLDATTGPVP